jgi:hypothetical protein
MNNLVIQLIKSSPTLPKNNIENYCVSKKFQYQNIRNVYVPFRKTVLKVQLFQYHKSGWESNTSPSI